MTYDTQEFTEKQIAAVIDLLWQSLKRDSEHADRRQTGWGTKTKEGLVHCIALRLALPRWSD